MKRVSIGLMGLAAWPAVFAHDGHGAIGPVHFHASDAWGFLMVGACLALAFWRGRK